MSATSIYAFFAANLPMFVWAGSHLAATRVRDEIAGNDGTSDAVRQNPLASYINTMLCSFGGGVVANLLLGVSPIEPIFMSTNFILGSLAWFLVFYCPGDLFYIIAKYPFYNTYLQIFDEIWRGIKVYSGIIQATAIAPHLFTSAPCTTCIFFIALIGTMKGCGGEILKSVRQYILGRDQSATPMATTTVVNTCFISAVLFSICSVLASSYMHLLFSVIITAFIATKIYIDLVVYAMDEEKYAETVQAVAFVALIVAILATIYMFAAKYLRPADITTKA